MEMKIIAKYKNGVLIPRIPLKLKENTEVEIILKDEIYDSFSIAGEDDGVGEYYYVQKEVIENE